MTAANSPTRCHVPVVSIAIKYSNLQVFTQGRMYLNLVFQLRMWQSFSCGACGGRQILTSVHHHRTFLFLSLLTAVAGCVLLLFLPPPPLHKQTRSIQTVMEHPPVHYFAGQYQDYVYFVCGGCLWMISLFSFAFIFVFDHMRLSCMFVWMVLNKVHLYI